MKQYQVTFPLSSARSKSARKKKVVKQETSGNYILLKVFLFFFVLAVVGSLVFRLYNLVQKSSFDDEYFNILVIGKSVYALNIGKTQSLVSVLKFENLDRSVLNLSSEALGVYFGVPFDSVIIYKENEPQDVRELFSLNNLYFLSSSTNVAKTGLNSFDMAKIYFSLNLLNSFDFKTQSYNFQNKNDEELNSKIYDAFKNNTIINDKISIEVINSSGITGAGTKFAQMLRNIGFNVIAVRSEDEKTSSKVIVRLNENDYSAKKLVKYLSMPVEYRNETSISDVSIIVGSNYVQKNIAAFIK